MAFTSSPLALLVLSACGGNHASGGDEEEFLYTETVIKSPLQNATVFLGYDGDGVLSVGEPTALSGADGSYGLTNTTAGLSVVVQTSEVTIDSLSVEILDGVTLKASAGSSVITPDRLNQF